MAEDPAAAVQLGVVGGGVRLRLRVKPSARRTRLVGAHGGALKLEVQAPPERGRANEAVVALLAEVFDVGRGRVVVEAGESSQDKVVFLSGVAVETAVERLARYQVTASPRS